jgi:hypothetical protein
MDLAWKASVYPYHAQWASMSWSPIKSCEILQCSEGKKVVKIIQSVLRLGCLWYICI